MASEESVGRGIATRPVERRRAGGSAGGSEQDSVAIEEPLELRVDGETVAITMRTPGDDALLAVGFLYAEGIAGSLADLGSVAHCGRPGDEGWGNVLEVRSGPGVSLDIDRVLDSRRWNVTSSACGVCGRKSVADLVARCAPLERSQPRLSGELLLRAFDELARVQANFSRTGGIHAAGAFDERGALLACHEDVGRHNAVDKTIGALLYRGQLGGAALLAVSGRSSFEIVQKAAAARIPVVASVSAPSSLAIDLAAAVGITLVGFVRSGGFNLYTHSERIV